MIDRIRPELGLQAQARTGTVGLPAVPGRANIQLCAVIDLQSRRRGRQVKCDAAVSRLKPRHLAWTGNRRARQTEIVVERFIRLARANNAQLSKIKACSGNGPDLARRDQVGIHGQILPCIDPKAMRAHILCAVEIEITVRGEVEQGWHVGFAIELDPQAQVTDKGIATRDPYRSRISLVAMRTVKGKQNAVRIRRLNGPGTIGEAIRPPCR